MHSPARLPRHLVAVPLALISAIVGCQGEDGFSLTPPGLDFTSAQAIKAAVFDPCSDPPRVQDLAQDVLDAVNSERARHHLRPLLPDSSLRQVAEFWACRMIEDGFFDHVDPYDGSTVDSRAVNFGYAFRRIGENLAAGHETPLEALDHWMRSPEHRAVILDPAFVHIGIAVKRGGEHGTYWVQVFGRPIPASADRPADKPTEDPQDEPAGQPASQPVAFGFLSESWEISGDAFESLSVDPELSP